MGLSSEASRSQEPSSSNGVALEPCRKFPVAEETVEPVSSSNVAGLPLASLRCTERFLAAWHGGPAQSSAVSPARSPAEHEHQQAAENDVSGQSHLRSPLPFVRTHNHFIVSSGLVETLSEPVQLLRCPCRNGYEYFAVRFLRKDSFIKEQ